MPNDYINKVNVNGTEYDVKDSVSGYITSSDVPVTDIKVDNTSVVSSKVANIATSSSHPYNASTNPLATVDDINEGTVTSVGLTNASDGGLSISGSPVTSSGSITVGHSNVLANAQSTQALYPIAIDKNGHITSYGSAASIPTKTSDLTNDGNGQQNYPFLTSEDLVNENLVFSLIDDTDANVHQSITNWPDTMFGLNSRALTSPFNESHISLEPTNIHIESDGNIAFRGIHIGATSSTPAWSPTDDNDFTTKAYVDTAISNIDTGTQVRIIRYTD